MHLSRTAYVIIASTLALLALILFQVQWMSSSRQLIEEQFNQQVSMALCSAVDNLNSGKFKCSTQSNSCVPVEAVGDGYQVDTYNNFDANTLDSALALSFNFHDIQMEYEVNIVERQSLKNGKYPQHSCSLNPWAQNDQHLLIINFPGKDRYIMGKMKFMLISSVLILLFITTVFIFANYTLLKQKRLSQISKDFFNNLAHEFRTPLTNISLAGKLLARRNPDEKEKRYLEVVDLESKKLMHQVERVLHLSKLENGEYQLEKESLCPGELLRQVITDLDIQIKAKEAKVQLNIEQQDMQMMGDKFHLGNAFRNLLDNALKYSGESPAVDITLKEEKDGILILFEDNGIGIPTKDQSQVFDKYQRVNTGNLHNQKGFGLGLSYVKMIVERHRGFIRVFSDLNKGTRFDLFLPRT